MPTQHDYRSAAGALRQLAVAAGASAVAVNDAHDDLGIVGGTATPIINAAMQASFLNASAVERSSISAADELERRAAVCADYTERMRRWRADYEQWQSRRNTYIAEVATNPVAADPGPPPSEPDRWPLWVEEG